MTVFLPVNIRKERLQQWLQDRKLIVVRFQHTHRYRHRWIAYCEAPETIKPNLEKASRAIARIEAAHAKKAA